MVSQPVARRNSLLKSAMAAQKKNNPSDHENDMGRANSVAKGQGGSDDSTSRGGTDKKGSTTRGGEKQTRRRDTWGLYD